MKKCIDFVFLERSWGNLYGAVQYSQFGFRHKNINKLCLDLRLEIYLGNHL